MPPDDNDTKEKEQETIDAKEKEDKEVLALAEAKKTEKEKENMIPQSRLNEEITRRKESDKKLATIEKEQAALNEKHLEEQGKYKELAEERATKLAELQPQADQVDSMAKTLKEILAAEIEALPEVARPLVPSELSDQQQLNWIAKNKTNLSKPNAFDIGAGKRGSENGEVLVDLTAEEKAMAKNMNVSEKDYAKNKKIKE